MTRYKTKALLHQEGTLVLRCKITSRIGQSIETGRSTTIDVRAGRSFILGKALAQCVYGHLKHVDIKSYKYLASNSDDRNFIEQLEIRAIIQDYHYEYNTYNGQNKFKQVIVKHKRYVQVWENYNGKYKFKTRQKVNYDSKKKLTRTKDELDL